jgi:hypothetical protein
VERENNYFFFFIRVFLILFKNSWKIQNVMHSLGCFIVQVNGYKKTRFFAQCAILLHNEKNEKLFWLDFNYTNNDSDDSIATGR